MVGSGLGICRSSTGVDSGSFNELAGLNSGRFIVAAGGYPLADSSYGNDGRNQESDSFSLFNRVQRFLLVCLCFVGSLCCFYGGFRLLVYFDFSQDVPFYLHGRGGVYCGVGLVGAACGFLFAGIRFAHAGGLLCQILDRLHC